MGCKICSEKTEILFTSKILKKYDVIAKRCRGCGFVSFSDPIWIEEAYEQSINVMDTGILNRNICFSKIVSNWLLLMNKKNARYLDFAGGYGIFVRLMRDYGFNFFWQDKYSQNMVAIGFEATGCNEQYDLITVFECFEHFNNPMNEIKSMLQKSDTILFSTLLLPKEPPSPDEWWYYGLEHGQHISFYSIESLKKIAETFGLHFMTNGKNLHVLSKRKYSKVLFYLVNIVGYLGFDILSKIFKKSKMVEDMRATH